MSNPGGSGLLVTSGPPPQRPLEPLSEYEQKVVRMRQRGLVYPYEVIAMLTPARGATQAEFPPGEFVEYDLDADGRLVPVERPPGQNTANVVVGVIRNFTAKYPEGMTRVILLGDPSKAMGAVAEPECRRIIAALDLAERMRRAARVVRVSAGAKISMESGTENMDWIARVLRRLIEFTQAGGEVNVVVNGINVGAQPYWNAEATMLLHTRGILVMTPRARWCSPASRRSTTRAASRPRTTRASAATSASWARTARRSTGRATSPMRRTSCCATTITPTSLPGERFPRRAATSDPVDRDVRALAARRRGLRAGRRHLLGRAESRTQKPVRHPQGDGGGDRPGPRAARALGGDARRRDRASSGTRTSAAIRSA